MWGRSLLPSSPLPAFLPLSHSAPSAAQSSKRRSTTSIPVTTIDLTEEDSRDSSRSSSTLSGSSSQEGQNGSTELGAEEPESRDAGMALEYQVWRGQTLLGHWNPAPGTVRGEEEPSWLVPSLQARGPSGNLTAASPTSSSLPALPCVSGVRWCRAVPVHRAAGLMLLRGHPAADGQRAGTSPAEPLPVPHGGLPSLQGPPRDVCAAHAGLAAMPGPAETGSCMRRKCFCRGDAGEERSCWSCRGA